MLSASVHSLTIKSHIVVFYAIKSKDSHANILLLFFSYNYRAHPQLWLSLANIKIKSA